jgi:hypothetical protein
MRINQNSKDIRTHFTDEHINNKELVKTMLTYEDTIIHGDIGKEIYADDSYEHFSTLEAMYTIHRIVLNFFNFKNTDDDILNYRKIFSRYYKSPNDYDEDVINCVTYMRENKCVFYKGKDYNIGDTFENIVVLTTNKDKVNILDKINKDDNYTFVGAFSNS